MKYAPIYIPTMCRSTHFIRQIESLKRNTWAKYTDVYVGIDFPQSEKHQEGWRKICEYVDTGDFSAFRNFVVIKREKNYGPSRNFQDLKERVSCKYDRYIYTDDDVEFSPNFLEYMDKCLERYESDPNVINVTGYSYPFEWRTSENATCLKQNINVSMWGCGFWVKKDQDIQKRIKNKELIKQLPLVIKEKRYKRMLDVTMLEYFCCAASWVHRKNDYIIRGGDIGRRAYLAVEGKYCISPVISKARNYGFDGSGVYCQTIDSTLNGDTARTYNYPGQPIDTEEHFNLIEDTLHYDEENKNRLNAFDYRSLQEMKSARQLIWICEHVGIWAAKTYGTALLCIELTAKAYRKTFRI